MIAANPKSAAQPQHFSGWFQGVPFHNMILLSPVTSAAQVDHLLHEMANAIGRLQEKHHD